MAVDRAFGTRCRRRGQLHQMTGSIIQRAERPDRLSKMLDRIGEVRIAVT
jgi:hypothetical protein